jgi:hypothetical protein
MILVNSGNRAIQAGMKPLALILAAAVGLAMSVCSAKARQVAVAQMLQISGIYGGWSANRRRGVPYNERKLLLLAVVAAVAVVGLSVSGFSSWAAWDP